MNEPDEQDISSEQAAVDLLIAASLLVRRLRAKGSGSEFISWTQAAVMRRLEAEPATIADLARSESIKPQSMGGSVAALEEQGLVERRPHPNDRRQFLFGLTEAGKQLRKASASAKQTWLAQSIDALAPADRKALLAAIEVIGKLGAQ